jgi:predicted transcriptional regulator
MHIKNLIIPTDVIRLGMPVKTAFQKCVAANVPGIPCVDQAGTIVGRASIRHILKETCIPDFMVKHVRLLGDNIKPLNIPDKQVRKVLALTVDPFILTRIATISSTAPIAKTLAVMENDNTTYIFVIDNGIYKGVVTIMGIARHMLDIEGHRND